LALSHFFRLAEHAKKNRNDARSFAATAFFLGLRHIDRQHYFTDSFVSSVPDEKMNVYSAARPFLIAFKNFSANGIVQEARLYADKANELGIYPSFSEERGLTIRFGEAEARESDEDKIVRLIDLRNKARTARNFKEADRIREELSVMGIELEDTKDGTKWKVKR
jgi:cysteinyl-tRNA synthetase